MITTLIDIHEFLNIGVLDKIIKDKIYLKII